MDGPTITQLKVKITMKWNIKLIFLLLYSLSHKQLPNTNTFPIRQRYFKTKKKIKITLEVNNKSNQHKY